ncbi:MAG: LPXTG cell wall anchor domain-containing protein [Lachnospiraceae bacterium]|nr:LPXTG cell wall anchor domain-containing protein [Lachnospiraceae bacterium]
MIPTGASFELYLADDFDDTTQKPKENAEVIASGTTGENGILSLGKLAEGEYRLLETEAPAGYVLTGSAVKITITETSVSAMLGTSNLQVNVKGDDDWVAEGQADDTHQIRVWNNPGAVLPATGGCGTSQIYLLGAMLTGIAGLWLVMRQRRKQLL